jgi:DNA polymerase-3 subunit epsilon
MNAVAWFRWWTHLGGGPPVPALREGGFVAIDLETTGLDPRRDAIVSLAAIPFVAGRPGEALVTLVDPGRPIPAASTAIHGITDSMVGGAPAAGPVVERLGALVAGLPLVGHGVGFDVAIVDRERRAHGLPPLANPALDTRALAAALHPEWADVELESVAPRLGVDVIARHTAEGDAVTAGMLLLALLPALESRGMRTLGDLLWFQRSGRRHA